MLTETVMLEAVKDRDAEYDGVFFYGVKTTGIFCRPSCSSRQAKPANMTYFGSALAARHAGFRACRKCQPDSSIIVSDKIRMVRDICSLLETWLADGPEKKPSLKMLAAKVGYSEDHLSRTFKKLVGVSPLDYFDALRNRRLKENLKSGGTVADAAYGAGFGSSSRLYEAASVRLGMSPASYAKGGRGAEIAYSIVDCFLGRMLVAGTRQGVCAVYFGDDDDQLIDELAEEFPKAEIGLELGVLSHWAERITRYLEEKGQVTLDVPLDIYGTAFQRLVWNELLKIAPGETKTYHQVATEMGRAKSSRAVGRACATNPVSLIVPCHRVMGSDGKLHGYRWGLERKEALIEWELEEVKERAEKPAKSA
ncbi:bifunctional transcriptional activator/DNA repair enzyme AdaA [Sneathiella limimaris]|uniref:bifunctional transcriptional activator/DNA repair enzyme AdaA n=1 Tax=Sneathiella limimaris TaxID=1964213 RepID=UPI00146ED40E|nr:methylated-DNA--[protein]-cysteine S-methyltransferase [Sneathiella limimaris]